MINSSSSSRFIIIASFLALQGTNLASARELICTNELASYQECIANQPYYCFPTCGQVGVSITPDRLKYLRDPSYSCNPMKLASCAVRGCCEQCSAEEAIYWSCVERESGCGEIDCKVVLGTTDEDTSTEPQNEEVPPEDGEGSTPTTGGSSGQVTDTADQNESTGNVTTAVVNNITNTNNQPQMGNSTPTTGGSNGQLTDTADQNESTGNGTSAVVVLNITNTNNRPPMGNSTTSVPSMGNSTAGNSSSVPSSSSSSSVEATCPGELGIFKQCVYNNSLTCQSSCADVDTTLKADDLLNAEDPSTLCDPMVLASCQKRSCCEECAFEEFIYWFCIERETGCGAIDCRDYLGIVGN